MCSKTGFNLPSTLPSYNNTQESNKKLQFIGICYSLSFLLWLKSPILAPIYSPILAPILTQIAYAVHAHTQFKMIGKKSYENECNL